MTSLEYYIEQVKQFISALTDDIKSGYGTIVTQTKLAVYREVLKHLEEIEQEPNYNSINPELNGDTISRQAEPMWIPVSEKLPEEGKEVLTCSNGGFIEIQSFENSHGNIYWENKNGDWTDIDEVIAWMPLPKPYKAESEEV